MRKVILWFVLPVTILGTLGLLCASNFVAAHQNSSWTTPLRAAAADADRLVVHDMDFFGKGPQPDCEIRGVEKVKEMLDLINIDASGSGFHCNCDGEYWIHLYKGDRAILTLGYHHGRSLRWHEGKWNGDGLLAAKSCDALPAWFKKNGCPYLQSLCDQERARKQREVDDETRFASFFPEKARNILLAHNGTIPINGNDDPVGKQIAEIIGDGKTTAIAVCRALGSCPASWSMTSDKERRALTAVHTVDGSHFQAALEQLRNDREGLQGAARVFFSEGFDKKLPEKVRAEWTVRLAEVVLTDGADENKPMLLRSLGKQQGHEIDALLRDIFRGKVGKEINRRSAYDQEPGLRTGAALMLVLKGGTSIKPEIAEMLPKVKSKPDVAALEICLALLGDPSYIKTEHFRLESYSIGLAGLKAIEQYKGKHGMEALVKGGIHHPWAYVNDEALKTFERLTGKKMSTGEIEDWWEVEHEGQRNRPQPILQLTGNTDQIHCVTFSRDGKLIAGGSLDSTAKVWDARTGEKVHVLRGHKSTVIDLAFHPDGSQLATGSLDGTIKIWDLATAKEIRTLTGHAQEVDCLTYSPDGKRIASVGADGVRIWDVTSGDTRLAFPAGWQDIKCLAFRPDGNRIALGISNGAIRICDPANGNVERTLKGHTHWVLSIAYDAEGSHLVTAGGEDKTVRIWDASKDEPIHTLTGHTEWVDSVAFSPDGKFVVSTGWDKMVKIWEVATGKLLVSFKAHPEWVNAVAYHPNGKWIATASEDKSIRVWDVESILRSVKAVEKK
jgi:WD40 repeat protein